ncbi:hypothetical protein ABLT40_09600 [Acinetobacter schindleri]|uniref:hypothetical protein n=1 Tax=Acinetobacter schindleri TaxID=108981 RepID=UPI0032B4DDAF
MKAIQFKKTDCQLWGNNLEAITKEFGGVFEFKGSRLGDRTTIFKAPNGQEKSVRLDDWILEIDGVIVVLNNEEYQLLQSEQKLKEIKDRIDGEVKQYQHRVQVGIVKPQVEPPKDLGQMISDSIKAAIKKDQQRGGLLTTESKDNAPDVDSTTIEDCRKRFQVKIDENSIIAGNKFSEGGFTKDTRRTISINIEWPKL